MVWFSIIRREKLMAICKRCASRAVECKSRDVFAALGTGLWSTSRRRNAYWDSQMPLRAPPTLRITTAKGLFFEGVEPHPTA